MKVIKLLAGGLVVVVTYNVGKLVGGLKVAKIVADELEDVFPGYKKAVAKKVSENVIDNIFDKSKEGEESQ